MPALRYYGDPILRKRCKPIASITDEIKELVQSIVAIMDEYDGIGLAAPQIGRDVRLFVLRNYIELKNGKWKLSKPRVYINPQLSSNKRLIIEEEGCLSFPKLLCKIARPDCVVVKAIDLNGDCFTEKVKSYNARVRIHENDHLNGCFLLIISV